MKRYLLFCAVALLFVLAATASFAWLVNPYGYWNPPDIAGLNQINPASGKHLRAVKERQYERLRPRTLIAGNSRVDVGFDPSSTSWPVALRPIYNLGLPGSGTQGVVGAVEKALFEHRVNAVLLGVDFLDFRLWETEWRAPPPPPPRAPSLTEELRLRSKLLLSLDALIDTLAAVAAQHKAHPADISKNGFNGLGEYHATVAAEGHGALFAQRNAENMKAYLGGSKRVFWGDPGDHPAFRALGRLARTARDRGISLSLFTYPYHIDVLLSFERAGLWPAYERWARALAEFSARSGVVVYMFSNVDPATTEPVPAEREPMKYYWEGGHFKAALGDRLIATMTQNFDERFVLTPASVDAYLERVRGGMAYYRQSSADAGARVDAAFDAAAQ